MLWYGALVRHSFLIGWAIFQLLGMLLLWKRGWSSVLHPLVALAWLGSCVAAAFSPQPQWTWWVAGLHAVALAWWYPTLLWRLLAFLGGLAGLGMPGAGAAEALEYATRLLPLLAAFWGLGYLERQIQPSESIQPDAVPVDDLPHPRYLIQRLSLYLQHQLPALGAEGIMLYLYDLSTGTLDVMLKLGSVPELVKHRARVMIDDGCVGICASLGRPIAFLSLLKPPKDLPKTVTWEGMPTLCLPLFDPDSPTGRALGVLQLFGSDLNSERIPLAQQVGTWLAEAIATVRRREAEHIANFQRLSAIVAQVEGQSPHTRGHSHRVAAIADLLAKELGLEEELREKLRTAALFHDIGKTRISSEILNKEGALNEEEKAIVRRYPYYSEEICANMGFDEDTLFLIRHHGERLDGSGYPSGLDASKQPLALRILAVADVFDTMACTRSYRASLSMEERLREMAKLAGSKLDVLVIETLRRAHLQGQLDAIYSSLSYEQPLLKAA